jgi:hypothetical protein
MAKAIHPAPVRSNIPLSQPPRRVATPIGCDSIATGGSVQHVFSPPARNYHLRHIAPPGPRRQAKNALSYADIGITCRGPGPPSAPTGSQLERGPLALDRGRAGAFRQPDPPRGFEASTIWSTIYANRSAQDGSHVAGQPAGAKVGNKGFQLPTIRAPLDETAEWPKVESVESLVIHC